ncbi:hypothetical protein ACFLYP_02100 [Chloroflexota bacterium]
MTEIPAPQARSRPVWLRQVRQSLRWTRSSYYLMSGFVLLLFLIGYVWWPLLEEYIGYFNPRYSIWVQIDWLLIGIFLFMSLMIMAQADIKADLPIVLIGLMGGLVIESWGTQTELWFYYTDERPPLWIIPAWPIASLSIDRLYGILRKLSRRIPERVFKISHWLVMPAFLALMLFFVAPTFGKSLTVMALVMCVFLTLTSNQPRAIVLTFIAGSGLGYFLELWGTTRLCWTYYTYQTPPTFAVLAHGMAAVAFWRVLDLYRTFQPRLANLFSPAKRPIEPVN